jgi:hypothetical protein
MPTLLQYYGLAALQACTTTGLRRMGIEKHATISQHMAERGSGHCVTAIESLRLKLSVMLDLTV